jgi:hypothetical protein
VGEGDFEKVLLSNADERRMLWSKAEVRNPEDEGWWVVSRRTTTGA